MIIGKRKHIVSHAAASGHATCHADVITASARSQPYADVILAIDDVSFDLVNVGQVNRGPRPGVSWAHMLVTVHH